MNNIEKTLKLIEDSINKKCNGLECKVVKNNIDLRLENIQLKKQIDLMAEVIFKKFKAPLIIEYGIENKEQFIKIFKQKAKEKRKEYEENNPDNNMKGE